MIAYPPYQVNRAAAPEPTHARRSKLLVPALLTAVLALGAQRLPALTLAWNPSSSPSITGYRLYQGGASQVYTNVTNVGPVTNATLSGLATNRAYYFAVTALNNLGQESVPSSEVAYAPSGSIAPPPAIVLTSPTAGATYTAPASVNLAANVTANGHTITKVQFYQSGTLLAEDTAAPYTLTLNNLAAGSASFSATAVYDTGTTVASPAVSVVINAPTSPPPASGLTFASTSGAITAPFVAANGSLSQSVNTGVTNGGRAAYSFSVPATGDYVISALVNAPSSAANSFYINIDGEPTDPFMTWDLSVTAGFASQFVAWRGNGAPEQDQFVPKVFNLTQGTHQLIVRGREANTQLGAITIAPAPTGTTLSAPWQTIDIGNPGLTGSAGVSSGVYTVAGAGTIGGSADSFRFVYQSISGDCDIRAQLTSVQSTGSSGSVGVMLRDSLTASSTYGFVGMSAAGGLRWQRRDTASGSTIATTSSTVTPPNFWVRLVRTGSTVTRYQSTDGVNWTSIYAYTAPMGANAYLGLVVASGSNTTLNTSKLANVTLIP